MKFTEPLELVGEKVVLGRCPVDFEPVEVRYAVYRTEDGTILFDAKEKYGGELHAACVRRITAARRRGFWEGARA